MLVALPQPGKAEQVRVCTSAGDFTIELAPEAPLHVANFLRLVDDGFYNGTIVHRVVGGRLVQGGAYDREFVRRPPGDPVLNESDNGLSNERGTVGAARLRDPDSAQSQFYVNLSDSPELDATSRRPGYTVFGRVTSGLAVLDAIGELPTGAAGPLPDEVPAPAVVIEAISRIAGADDSAVPADSADLPTAGGDAAAALIRTDALRAACEPVPPTLLIDEAEAALAAGLVPRGRYALDNYFAITQPDDADIPRAQALFRTLPRTEQAGIAALIAHCPRGVSPALPDGRAATLDQMEQAQAHVRAFLMSTEAFLDCLSDVIDGGSLDDVQEVAAVSAHNEAVTLMERTAEDFNRELRAYRSRN